MSASTGADRSVVSRRTLIKTGANVAWAVPAITVVSAAPAYAVSGEVAAAPDLAITSFSFAPAAKDPKAETGTLVFKNNGAPTPPSLSITLTVANPGTQRYETKPSIANVSGGGFTLASTSPAPGTPWVYTLTSGTSVPSSGTVTVTFDVVGSKAAKSSLVTMGVSVSTAGDSASSSASFT